jgi:hypothetical protein
MICDCWYPVNPGIDENLLAALVHEIIKDARDFSFRVVSNGNSSERNAYCMFAKRAAR